MATSAFTALTLRRELRKCLAEKPEVKPLLHMNQEECLPKPSPFAFLITSEEDSAMVFVSNEVGEHSITTRDLSVNENTIIQFEVLTLFY